MVMGAYAPRWVNAHYGGTNVRAICFVADRAQQAYTGRLTDEQIVTIALRASGHYGTCMDYLLRTAASLRTHGIADTRLARLAEQVAVAQRRLHAT